MVCEYTFVVSKLLRLRLRDNYFFLFFLYQLEWYETLSKACFDCPFNQTDCFRPHCVFADGIRRTILVINRMMPGPPINVTSI